MANSLDVILVLLLLTYKVSVVLSHSLINFWIAFFRKMESFPKILGNDQNCKNTDHNSQCLGISQLFKQIFLQNSYKLILNQYVWKGEIWKERTISCHKHHSYYWIFQIYENDSITGSTSSVFCPLCHFSLCEIDDHCSIQIIPQHNTLDESTLT